MKEVAIEHMNKDHADIVKAFAQKLGGIKEYEGAKIADINEDGMQIVSGNESAFVPFLSKAKDGNFKDVIIELYSSIKKNSIQNTTQEGLISFVDGFKTVIISSQKDGKSVSSYAPFVKVENEIYITLSSVAEHYHAIKQNPDKISVMFLQDEAEAKSAFARVRVSFEAAASFMSDEDRERIFDKFEEKFSDDPSLKFIRAMKDFYVVKISLGKGRYVKGFGAAFDTQGFEILNGARVSNPHTKK
ncbi:HugZ family heme oxygenase [Campylobacter suis]|uniref:Heme oxygenase n=1 Tax=Campylobacter suis TaxID=2790657 RepID=A0ABM8Q2J3_9BACT|nr:HugZ family heme oxygenase [Campylobacter suis]CAD7286969.1 putative heme oxygenase [Campylobacter suis]